MAPNYGEESKNPKKIVPRAMYISVIGLGIFYTITSWAAISGYASTAAAANVAQNNSAEFFFIPAKQFGNEFLKDALSYFIITGSFACGMAFHNTTARYMYSLGREGVLPPGAGAHARAAPQPAHRLDHAVGDRADHRGRCSWRARAPAASPRRSRSPTCRCTA